MKPPDFASANWLGRAVGFRWGWSTSKTILPEAISPVKSKVQTRGIFALNLRLRERLAVDEQVQA
jgi:hypothetical protein